MTKKFYSSLVLALLMALPMAAQGVIENVKTNVNNNQQRTQVLIKTTMGDITVALYNETPRHRDNFLKLVAEHYYDSVLFHRVIKDFMVQTGDGNSRHAAPGQMLGNGDLDYTVPAEFVYPKFFHKRGAFAAARTGDQVNPERASSASQFYIVTGKVYDQATLNMMQDRMSNQRKNEIFRSLAEKNRSTIIDLQSRSDTAALRQLEQQLISEMEAAYALHPVELTPEQVRAYTTVGGTPHLDGQYTVYGEVTDGMDVVDRIQNAATGANDRPVEDIRILEVKVLE